MKTKHPVEIPGFEGRMQEFAEFIARDLRYDRAADLHQALAEAYENEAVLEASRNHPKNAVALRKLADLERQAATAMRRVWDICKPYTEH